MNPELQDEIRQALIKAAEAMRQKDKAEAFAWAAKAASLAPELEEPWLILAASCSPQTSLEYLNRALQINPQSQKAQQGVVWAKKRLETTDGFTGETIKVQTFPPSQPPQLNHNGFPVENTKKIRLEPQPVPKKNTSKWLNIFLFWVGLFVVFCVSTFAVSAFATGWIVTSATLKPQAVKQVALNAYQTPTATEPAPPTLAPTPKPSPTITLIPSSTSTLPPFSTPIIPTQPPVVKGILVTPLPTRLEAAAQIIPPSLYAPADGERWIDVNLSQQKLYAYEGPKLVKSFLISSGVAAFPTITGQYRIYVKYRFDDMQGPGYFLPNVPYVLYFHDGYGIHGTYWHNNFGHPMSHGCVNMSIPDAGWIYDWASEGTMVSIHS